MPASLGNLANLRVLLLDHTRLRGQLPMSLAQLTKLENVCLAFSYFSGELPPLMVSREFHLVCRSTMISGPLLTVLRFVLSAFRSGVLPPSLGKRKIGSLTIGSCNFTGQIVRSSHAVHLI